MKKLHITSLELPHMVGKTVQEVYDYVKKEYPNRLPLDGIDFYDNEKLKDGNYHLFFGSVFRHSNGDWNVPYVQWDGSSFDRSSDWLENDWSGDCRVVLLETVDRDSDPLASLELRVAKLEKKLQAKKK